MVHRHDKHRLVCNQARPNAPSSWHLQTGLVGTAWRIESATVCRSRYQHTVTGTGWWIRKRTWRRWGDWNGVISGGGQSAPDKPPAGPPPRSHHHPGVMGRALLPERPSAPSITISPSRGTLVARHCRCPPPCAGAASAHRRGLACSRHRASLWKDAGARFHPRLRLHALPWSTPCANQISAFSSSLSFPPPWRSATRCRRSGLGHRTNAKQYQRDPHALAIRRRNVAPATPPRSSTATPYC